MVQKSNIFIGFLVLISCLRISVNGKTIRSKTKAPPVTCYECVSSAHDDACDSDPSTITTTCDADTTIPACYTYLENDLVTRSCDAPAECSLPYCVECNEDDNCNDDVFSKRKCIVCNSDRTDQSECATGDPVPSTFEQECEEYENVCFTEIVNKYTNRGCLRFISTCNAPGCEHCDTPDNCNNKLFPDNRKKCYSCSGNTCVDVTAADIKVCKNYEADEQCYVNVVDETNVNRGCDSDDDFLDKCINEGAFCQADYAPEENDKTKEYYQCFVCDSENTDEEDCAVETIGYEGDCEVLLGRTELCFWYEEGTKFSRGCIKNLPDGCVDAATCTLTYGHLSNDKINLDKCIKCDSSVTGEEECENDPSAFTTICPTDDEKSGCYLQIIDGKHIRGCASELTIDPADCAGGDTMCNICQGNNCNENDFQICQECSNTGPACATGRDEIPTTVCYDYSDKCIIHIDGEGMTHRGCEKELDLGVTCIFPNCIVCGSLSCINEIFPQDRTQCYTCTIDDGEDCFKEQTDPNKLNVCEKYVTDDKCFIVVEELNKAERGCVSDENEVCIGSDLCELYDSKGNHLDGMRTGKCYKCSSEDLALDPSCNNNLIEDIDCDSFLGVGPVCYYYQDGDVFERGCLDVAIGDIADKCRNGNPNCHIYTGDHSNSKTDIIQCITCDSEKGEACENASDLENIKQEVCPQPTDDNDLCYLRIDEGNIKRGCYSDLDAAGKLECSKNEICKTCYDDGCNRKVAFQKCFICNSNTNAQCAEIGIGVETCDIYTDKCKILVTESGKTERGCSTDVIVANCENNELCVECEEESCNVFKFPDDRSMCHQCASTDPNCSTNVAAVTPKVCQNYKSNEKCYSAIGADGKITRGCLSDTGSDTICKTEEQNCETCDAQNTDGCNKHQATSPTKLKCIQCTSDKAECAWEYDESTRENCKNPIALGKKEWCYRHKTSDNKVVRGCGQNDETPCGEDEGNEEICKTCEEDGCNYEYVVNSKCKICDSATEAKCKDNAKDLPNSNCTDNQFYENRGCFTQVKDGNTKRGCFANLSPDEMSKCEDNADKSCEKCLPDGCNSSATALQILSITLVGTVILLYKLI